MNYEKDAPQNEVYPKRSDNFRYVSTTEGNDDAIVRDARRVHAKSYVSEGFLDTTAIDSYGEVSDAIDKARGDAVTYYVGYDKDNAPVSTLRTIDAEKSGGYEFLPGYEMAQAHGVLRDDARDFLQQAVTEGRPIKEISSFGHIPEVPSVAGLEILRHAFQEARSRNEVWFFTMVADKSRALTHAFGDYAFRNAGEPILLADDGVNNVELVPGIVDTAEFLDDVAAAVFNETNEKYRRRYAMSLQNYSDGIAPAALSDDVRRVLQALPDEPFTHYAARKKVQSTPEPWTQPLALDFSNRFDKNYAKRLVDSGDIIALRDPRWGELVDADAAGAGVATAAAATTVTATDDSRLAEKEGTWFVYPWNREIVHFPDEPLYADIIHRRDRNMVTKDEQAILKTHRVLFAGLSVGSHVAEHMSYAGIGSTHYYADFDTIDGTNLNRIHAGARHIGEAKTDWMAKQTSELNPYMTIKCMPEGINELTLDELETLPDIIFDEVDDFAAKALLRLYAQQHEIPLIMASDVGYTSIIDVERYDKGAKLFNGRLSHDTVRAMLRGELSPKENMAVTTKLIGLSNASFRLLQSVNDPTLESFPQMEVSAAQGGALATVVARDILLGRNVKSGRSLHNARRDMNLRGEESLRDGIASFKDFLKNTYTTRAN